MEKSLECSVHALIPWVEPTYYFSLLRCVLTVKRAVRHINYTRNVRQLRSPVNLADSSDTKSRLQSREKERENE